MANRRSFFGEDKIAMPATTMNVMGSGASVDPDNDNDVEAMESKESFRRRTTPITGAPRQVPTSFDEVLAMLRNK